MDEKRPRVVRAPISAWDHTVRAALLVFVLLVLVLLFPGTREMLDTPMTGIATRGLIVRSLTPPADSSGLEVGDEIMAVDGTAVRNRIHYQYVLSHEPSRLVRVFTVRRGQAARDYRVEFRPPSSEMSRLHAAQTLLAFVFILVGVWVYGRRPGSIGLLFASVCALLAFFLTRRPSPPYAALQLVTEIAEDVTTLLFPAVLVHFFLRFPAAPGRRHREGLPRRKIARIYIAPGVIAAAGTLTATARFQFLPVHPAFESTLLGLSMVYFAAYVVMALVVFVRRYQRSEPAQKQKLRVVMAGSVLGFVPLILVTVLRNSPGTPQDLFGVRLESIAVLCLSFVPVSFAYAILKHNAIELNLVVRRSIVYACLTGGIVAVYYLLVRVLTGLLVDAFGVSEYVWGPLTILLLAVLFAPARDGLQRLADRLFYRRDVRYTTALIEFNRGIASSTRRADVLTHFIGMLEKTTAPSFVVLYRLNADSGWYEVERTAGETPPLPDRCSADCFLSRYLNRFRRPLMVEYIDPEWAHRHADAATTTILDVEDLAVCLPLPHQDGLSGVVLLGRKRSTTAYTREDSELLQTIAEQTARVLENADLLASSIERERLKSEVMLARDIQLSLLPDAAPEVDGLTIAGRMASSLEVGGDYFDYFALPDGKPCVCIGDVSGKGVPAAMLMSSLRAVFRHAVIKTGLAPAEVHNELNEFVVHNARSDNFASFFYGVLDPQSWTCTYSSAGHCPALLVRDNYVDRLGEGGLLLGADAASQYSEGRVHLEPGDHLVLYTDGVTEQSDPAGNLYEDERLISFLRANRNLPAPALLQRLFEELDRFSGGVQSDDITIVIVNRTAR